MPSGSETFDRVGQLVSVKELQPCRRASKTTSAAAFERRSPARGSFDFGLHSLDGRYRMAPPESRSTRIALYQALPYFLILKLYPINATADINALPACACRVWMNRAAVRFVDFCLSPPPPRCASLPRQAQWRPGPRASPGSYPKHCPAASARRRPGQSRHSGTKTER
jgi:hypothetical protein